MGSVCSSSARAQPALPDEVRRPYFQPQAHRVIRLTRGTEASLGLRLVMEGDGVHASGIYEGSPMHEWNLQHPSMRVCCGDRILSVNGIKAGNTWSSWCAILGECRKSSVEIVVAPCRTRALRPQGASTPTNLDHLLPPDLMDSFKRGTEGACNATECPICLEELEDDGTSVQLPCRHTFHLSCVEEWFARCPTFRYAHCPTCRAKLSRGGHGRKSLDALEEVNSSATDALEGIGLEMCEEHCHAASLVSASDNELPARRSS